ncbi:MAG: YoaK family protein [Cyclobacteriaceae bacterium]
MIRHEGKKRKHLSNLQMGGITATAAGMVNVASVMAFFTFTSNITGHMAIFSEELVRGNWHQSVVVLIWLFAFLIGAFSSNFLINKIKKYGLFLSNSITILIQIMILIAVATYGKFYYDESLLETEIMVAALLFSMGYQNGLVATITNGVVKTTHLTGLFTDLGIALSLWSRKSQRKIKALQQKLQLQIVIAFTYFTGGLIGGFIFASMGFSVFYFASLAMLITIVYDLVIVLVYKSKKKFALALQSLFRKWNLVED